ncbi:hypothetical protein O3M35_005279 [Rhynocoris fuscipes]|uniref:Uncharacterized protein n=1 Tax=Rhynocoris fuscipes TaxID=488301 RepID=A0AAW1DIJ9_9HEMI
MKQNQIKSNQIKLGLKIEMESEYSLSASEDDCICEIQWNSRAPRKRKRRAKNLKSRKLKLSAASEENLIKSLKENPSLSSLNSITLKKYLRFLQAGYNGKSILKKPNHSRRTVRKYKKSGTIGKDSENTTTSPDKKSSTEMIPEERILIKLLKAIKAMLMRTGKKKSLKNCSKKVRINDKVITSEQPEQPEPIPSHTSIDNERKIEFDFHNPQYWRLKKAYSERPEQHEPKTLQRGVHSETKMKLNVKDSQCCSLMKTYSEQSKQPEPIPSCSRANNEMKTVLNFHNPQYWSIIKTYSDQQEQVEPTTLQNSIYNETKMELNLQDPRCWGLMNAYSEQSERYESTTLQNGVHIVVEDPKYKGLEMEIEEDPHSE